MRGDSYRKIGSRVIYGTIAVGNIVYFNIKNETNRVKNIELKTLFDELNDNTIDEYIQYREIKLQVNENIESIDEILDFIYFTFDTGVIRRNFVRYVHEKKYDVPRAFHEALNKFIKSPKFIIPVELLCKKEEIRFFINELKSRLISRYESVMLQRLIRNLDFDFILYTDEFKKEYFYNLPKQIQGIICKNCKDEDLAFSFAHEFELPLAIHDFEFQENSLVIIDGIENIVIVDPSVDIENQYQEKLRKYTYIIGEDSSYSPSKINIYAPMVDTRILDKIAYGNWYTGVAPFKTEFIYSTKGTLPSYKEQYDLFHHMFTVMKDKEVYIRIPDFRPERPTELLGEIFTDTDTFDQFTELFQTNMLAIANASKDTGKQVNMLVPMIRMSSEIPFWRREIKSVFEYCNQGNVKVGIMFETGSAYDYYEEYKGMDFVIIGLNDLVEEISDDYDRYSHMSKEEIIETFWPNLRDLHQYFRSYRLQTKHILAGNFLSNPEVFRKFLKSGFRDFSIRASEIKLIEKVLTKYNETRGMYIGVAAAREADQERRRIKVILRNKREREEKNKRAANKLRKKLEKEQKIRDQNKEKREEVLKTLLSKNKKNNNDDENNEND